MSMEDAREFLQEAWDDEELRAELMVLGAQDQEAAFTGLIQLADENGFRFSREEFRAANLEQRKALEE